MRLDTSDMRMVRDRTRASMAYADEKYLKARRAERMRQWYRGDHYNPNASLANVLEADRMVINYTMINVLVKIASLLFGQPSFRVKARRRTFADQLKVVKPVLEYVFRETKALRALRQAMFDCKVAGTGVVGTNWRLSTAGADYDWREDSEIRGPILYDNPVCRRIKPEWWLVDPDSQDNWRDSWYVGEKWQLPLIVAKARYRHVADRLKGMVRSKYGDGADNPRSELGGDDHLRKIEGYTVYLRDLECRVDWSEELPEDPLFVGDTMGTHYPTDWSGRPYFPYAMIQNIPDLETHYGIGDAEVTETQQAEIDLARSQLAQVRRQNNGQLFLVEGTMEGDSLDKFQTGKQGAIIIVKLLPGQKLEDIMRPAPRENIQPEAYASIDKAQMDMSEMSRAAAFRRGMTMPGLKYATEAALAAQGVQGLEADERAQCEAFVAEVAEQYVHLLHRWAGELREIETAGGVGAQTQWLDWSGKDLAGDFEFTVEQSSMDPPDSQLEEQKWAARIGTIAPHVMAGVNIIPLIEAYLNSFDFQDVERVIPQQRVAGIPGAPGTIPIPGGMGNEANLGGDRGLPQATAGEEEGDLPGVLAALSGAGAQG